MHLKRDLRLNRASTTSGHNCTFLSLLTLVSLLYLQSSKISLSWEHQVLNKWINDSYHPHGSQQLLVCPSETVINAMLSWNLIIPSDLNAFLFWSPKRLSLIVFPTIDQKVFSDAKQNFDHLNSKDTKFLIVIFWNKIIFWDIVFPDGLFFIKYFNLATLSLLVNLIPPCRGERMEKKTKLMTELLFYLKLKILQSKLWKHRAKLTCNLLFSSSFDINVSHSYSIIANFGSQKEIAFFAPNSIGHN